MKVKMLFRIIAYVVFLHSSMLLAQENLTLTTSETTSEIVSDATERTVSSETLSSEAISADEKKADAVETSSAFGASPESVEAPAAQSKEQTLNDVAEQTSSDQSRDQSVDAQVADESVQAVTNAEASSAPHPSDSSENDGHKAKNKDSDNASRTFWEKVQQKSKFSLKTRLFAHYELSDKFDSPNHFELSMARLNFEWSHAKALQAAFEYDFSNLVDGDEVRDGVRDAFLRIEPFRWFGVQLGQFKKPFSRIELTSRKQLPTFSRGEANDFMVGFLQFGDRDLGLMVSGRLIKKLKLDYAVGVFNGGGPGKEKLGEGSKDVAFRLEARPLKWLDVGASASARIIRDEDLETVFEPSDYEGLSDADYPAWFYLSEPEQMAGFIADYSWLTGTHWMGEVDMELKFDHFEAMLEGMMGKNWWFEESPYIWSVTSVMCAPFPVADGRLIIEPALLAEVIHIEDDTWTWKARMLEISPGVNVHFGKNFRVMVHGEFIRTQGSEADFDEAPLRGFWPGEWPGDFVDSTTLYVQMAYAN